MDIKSITDEFVGKHRERAFSAGRRRLYPEPSAAWRQGWQAAMRFAVRVNDAYNICEQCGKLITDFQDLRYDNDFTPFCARCYTKVFDKER